MLRIVPAHRHGHRNGQQSGHTLHLRFVCCRPGSRRGDTEPVVARWWHLVTFMKALVMLHWAMRNVLYRRTATAIKMVSKVDTFFIFVLFAVTLAAAGVIRSQ